MSVSFWVRKDSTRACSAWVVAYEPGLLLDELLVLGLQAVELCRDGRPAAQAPRGEVLAVLRECLTRLVLQLGGGLLQLLGLQLDPLPGRGDVGHAPPYLLQLFELLLVGKVERLAGSSTRSMTLLALA